MRPISGNFAQTARSAGGISESPYWLDGLPAPPKSPLQIPTSVDVVIVGSGYTGLNAAIETARAGRSTLVLEAGDPGQGCSTRNGGQVSTSIKPSLEKLSSRVGEDRARAIRNEGKAALEWIEARIAEEGIDCAFSRCGRFHAAHSPEHYENLARMSEYAKINEDIDFFAVPRGSQRSELGTDHYFGGVVYPSHASLDPAKYHRGLLDAALASGAQVVKRCEVFDIRRDLLGFILATQKGQISARNVVVATNGYTTQKTQWLRRRVIPVSSHVIATEPLPDELVKQLFPTGRIAVDTYRLLHYFRLSPDQRRILFGGKVVLSKADPAVSGRKLHNDMCRIFPELRRYKITHSWMGNVAHTFDQLAHTGVHDGIHYALGYCGSGVSMASYLGMKVGQKVLGRVAGRTAFDNLPFPARPLYSGRPWFLPAVTAWYRWRDKVEHKRAEAALQSGSQKDIEQKHPES